MQVASSTVGANISSSLTAASRSAGQPDDQRRPKAAPTVPQGRSEPPAVEVSLSADALPGRTKATAPPDVKTVYYRQFFPAREGFDTSALASAVSDPDAQSSSAGKTLDQAAVDTRARMDAKYAAMDAAGEPFNPNAFEGRDWYALMGDLDRRSLLAIRENVGGLFSEAEQAQADFIMNQQLGMAMGLGGGPISQASKWHDPFAGNWAARYEAAGTWLDKASFEEKQSGEWFQRRAGAETGLRGELRPTEEPDHKPKSLLELLFEANKRRDELARQHDEEPRVHSTDGVRLLRRDYVAHVYAQAMTDGLGH